MMSALQDINISLDSLHHLPAKKRLDFIINHKTPLKIVRETPTAELLLIIRDVGAESSLELVEMMHPTQIQELFDLEVWSNDQLNPKALGHYFSLLFEANAETAVTQIYHLDMELIGVMFKMAATIYDQSIGEEPYDYTELYSTSPDQRFVVCFSDEPEMNGLSQMLHTFLESLYGRHLEFALRFLESVRFELASGLEEQSLLCRQNRLLDFGILPREERLQFFSPVTASEIKKLASNPQDSAAHDGCVMMSNSLVQKSKLETFPFLKAALSNCSDEQKDKFWRATVFASANMHASLSGDFGDTDVMSETANYVKFLIEVGLFQTSKGKLEDATRALEHYPVKFLIRLGRTALTTMRRRVTSKIDKSDYLFGKDFCHVDSPLRETAKALVLPEPRFYEGLLSAKKLNVRYFSSLGDLNITIAAVNELLFRAHFVSSACMGYTGDLAKSAPLTHANIFARCLINSFLKREDLLHDIKAAELKSIFIGSDLTPLFVSFADSFVDGIVKRVASDFTENETAISEKAHHFKSAVLIQLSQNSALALG